MIALAMALAILPSSRAPALALHQSHDTVPVMWTPHRVFDTHTKQFIDLESLAQALSQADVVFIGEQHDDAGTHRMQRAILEAVGRRRNDVVLAMEMFERDVQPVLDRYLAGQMDEAAFLAASRPWPNYATDYRPLVEYAKSRGWRVIAGNVPRRIASASVRQGMAAVTSLPDSSRPWAAQQYSCPEDRYYDRFVEAIGDHPMGPGPAIARDSLKKLQGAMYLAQCVKDETMAESIVAARGTGEHPPLVIHVNGDFHSDFAQGTAARVKRRLPKAKIAIVSALPGPTLPMEKPKVEKGRADFLVFTIGKSALSS